MQNGLLEIAPFMTIRVGSKNGVYPSPVDFIDIHEGNVAEILTFAHGECGGELEVNFARTENVEDRHFSIHCQSCGAEIKMYRKVFLGELGGLGIYPLDKFVANAYRFVLNATPPKV